VDNLMAALEPYRDLRAGPGADRFIVEGAVAVERLLASAFEIESIVCTPSQRARLQVPAHVPVIELPRSEIAALVGFDFHRGVLACARRPPVQRALEGALLEQLRGRETVTVVVAEALADPRNLGALLRNLAAFSADLLIADARGADPLSRLGIRASVGNVFRVPWIASDALPETITTLARALAARVIAATPDAGAVDLPTFRFPAKRVLLVGNEGFGLSPALLELADVRVRIPIAAASDSINVAAATAVLLYAARSC
jgi:tRNA G18 (ribose-2'-O)-methylase SpoU